MKTKLLWKTIPQEFKNHGHKWAMRKWFHVDGEMKLCENGFHASPRIIDALGYVKPGWVCLVKVRGEIKTDGDKSVCSGMMILRRWEWTKEMSVKLAIYAAELVLPIFEAKYPNDKRPAEAIAAAKKYLKNPTAYAAYAAHAAANAAANAASYAANAAAYAAYAAHAAANAASHAAYAEKILDKIEKKIKQLIGIK
jgi:hypothetical protein